MKFGKLIRAEALRNPEIVFINYKLLKYHLNAWVKVNIGDTTSCTVLDKQFCATLQSELAAVEQAFCQELQNIRRLYKKYLLKLSGDGEKSNDSLVSSYQISTFERTDIRESHKVSEKENLYSQCSELNGLSIACKNLQRSILWNSLAVVKVIKKRNKYGQQHPYCHYSNLNAGQLLSSQEWYKSRKLSLLNSCVETTMEKIMQHLSQTPLKPEHYHCPICLDLIVDPVCLRVCGHRFCWTCLCMTYCEKSEGNIEKCPCCRAVFHLSPEAFRIDSVLSHFLKNTFPKVQIQRRIEEKQEEICCRLISINDEQHFHNDIRENSQSVHHDILSPFGVLAVSTYLEQADSSRNWLQKFNVDRPQIKSAGKYGNASINSSKPIVLNIFDSPRDSQKKSRAFSHPTTYAQDETDREKCEAKSNSSCLKHPSNTNASFLVTQMIDWLCNDNQASDLEKTALTTVSANIAGCEKSQMTKANQLESSQILYHTDTQFYYEAIDASDDDFEALTSSRNADTQNEIRHATK